MKTITKQVYEFEELSPEAQEKALRELAGINVEDGYWYADTLEHAKEFGFEIAEFDIDRKNSCKIKIKTSCEEICREIMANCGKESAKRILAEIWLAKRDAGIAAIPLDENGDADDSKIDDFLDEIEPEFIHDLQEHYLSILRESYCWNISDEAIKETIIANGYDFNADGSLSRF